jgi:hypothetical protein
MNKDFRDVIQEALKDISNLWAPEIGEYPGSKLILTYDPCTEEFNISLYQEERNLIKLSQFNLMSKNKELY